MTKELVKKEILKKLPEFYPSENQCHQSILQNILSILNAGWLRTIQPLIN